MKNFTVILSFIAITIACKSVKKVQIVNAAIAKKDTVQTVVIKEAERVDSAAIVREIMSKVGKGKINFSTFNAKLKVDYEGQETSQNVTAYLSMKKDSVIYVRLTVPIIGTVAQIIVTKDSVFLLNPKKNTVQYRSINYLQEATQIPFDFYTLQDVIIGNPIFLSRNVVAYKSTDQQLLVNMVGKIFKHLITLDNTDFKPLHSKLDDIDPMQNRTCDITFSEYETKGDIQFATYRSISVSQKSKLDIYLNFKDYKFNEPLNYVFVIPKNYKRL